MTTANRRAGKRPERRKVTVTLDGEYEGWTLTAYADFPARILTYLQSDKIADILSGLDKIVIEHNFPDSEGKIADSLLDVEPYEGTLRAAEKLLADLGNLPKR